jgi:bacterioferritin-associated ferredoxin
MYVCVCNAITDRAIHDAVALGIDTLDELRAHTGLADGCGTCVDLAGEILADARARRSRSFPLALAIAA